MDKQNKRKKLSAYTIIETVISLALISMALMAMFNAMNYIYRANIFIDDRIAIRDQMTFVIRYLEERLRNANPSAIYLNSGNSILSWHAVGQNTIYELLWQKNLDHPYFANKKYSRLVLRQSDDNGKTYRETVLTYPGLNVVNVEVSLGEPYYDKITMLTYRTITIHFVLESTRNFGKQPLVRNVNKYLNILVVN